MEEGLTLMKCLVIWYKWLGNKMNFKIARSLKSIIRIVNLKKLPIKNNGRKIVLIDRKDVLLHSCLHKQL